MCDYEIIIIKETTEDISGSNTDITTNPAWFKSVLLLLLLLLLQYLLLHFKVHAQLFSLMVSSSSQESFANYDFPVSLVVAVYVGWIQTYVYFKDTRLM